MAKGKIFIGDIMADMVAALGSIDDTMLSQIAKTDEQIIELQNINDTVGQGIQAGNIIDGTENIIVLNAANVVATATSADAYAEIGRVKCFSKGKIRISGRIVHATSSARAQMCYSTDGGTTKILFGTEVANVETDQTVNINVTDGLEVIVFIKSRYASGSGASTCIAETGTVSFNLINLVTDGFVVKV